MLNEILRDTPLWVFPAFLVLFALGYAQTKPRQVRRARIYLLPCLMVALSANGVISAFGPQPMALVAWLAGAAVAFGVGTAFLAPKNIAYDKETGLFSLQGSWVPLSLFMLLFVTKYAVGGMLAHHFAVTSTVAFIETVGFLYGCFSGLFFSRAAAAWRAARKPAAIGPQAELQPR